jgi:hypothetical protein
MVSHRSARPGYTEIINFQRNSIIYRAITFEITHPRTKSTTELEEIYPRLDISVIEYP